MKRMLLASLMLLAACDDAGRPDAPSAAARRWRIDSVPIFALADVNEEGEPSIGLATGVARLPGGEVLVADQGLYALRWFAGDGTLLRTVGRQGLGPGEFGYLAAMYRCGNAIYVWDLAQVDELQRFDLDGTARESMPINRPPSEVLSASRCNMNGGWMHMGYGDNRDIPLGRHRRTAPFWLVAPDGSRRASLGLFPGVEWLVEPDGEGVSLILHPLGRMPVFAVGRDRAYVGTADSFVVRVFTLDGEPAGTLRDDRADLRTERADEVRFRYRDTLGANARDRAERIRRWDDVEFPATVPAYDAMLVDAEDLVWIRRYPRVIGAAAEWLVFHADGATVARLELPETLTVHEIGADYIAGIELHPVDGRQSVRVYRLRRGA